MTTWIDNSDGEYNEQVATANGHRVTVASDRDGGDWFYQLDDGEMLTGFDSKYECRRAAEEALLDAAREEETP